MLDVITFAVRSPALLTTNWRSSCKYSRPLFVYINCPPSSILVSPAWKTASYYGGLKIGEVEKIFRAAKPFSQIRSRHLFVQRVYSHYFFISLYSL